MENVCRKDMAAIVVVAIQVTMAQTARLMWMNVPETGPVTMEEHASTPSDPTGT